MTPLAAYVVAASLAWSPVAEHLPRVHDAADEAVVVAFREAIAADVAEVVADPNEQPLFPGDLSKGETAVQIGALAFFEGRFWSYVDNGSCNDANWKKAHGHDRLLCDGSAAWSLWQLHDGFSTPHGWDHGLAFDGDGWVYDSKGYRGRDLVRDRKLAARMALHFARKSLKASGTLCGYTGEPKGSGCPKAKARRDLAHAYFVSHPFAAE
jgi:hypothetical protein